MYAIQGFTTDPKQKLVVQLADGTNFTFRVYYDDFQKGWFIAELTYQGYTIYGMRIVNSNNLIRQYKNTLPFGLYVTTPGSREAMLITDLSVGNTVIYVMSAAEVAQNEVYLSGR